MPGQQQRDPAVAVASWRPTLNPINNVAPTRVLQIQRMQDGIHEMEQLSTP